MKRFLRNQAGDTIVEVVIAVAVVSVLLAGAFTVTNRSTRAVRDSEEHAQALQLLQGQVELLRAAATQPGLLASLPSFNTVPFCFDSSGVPHQSALTSSQCFVLLSSGSTIGYRLTIYGATAAPAPCQGVSCATTTFNLTATWPSLDKKGNNTVYLSYKVAVQQ